MNIVMENTPFILSVSTFFVLILLYVTVTSILSARKKDKDLINRTEKWSNKVNGSEFSLSEERSSERKKGLFGFLRLPGKDKKRGDDRIFSDTPLFYQRAGIYNRNSIRFYKIVRFILFLTPLALLTASHVVYQRPVDGVLLAAAFACGYIAYCLPLLWLNVVAHYRKKELNRTFPDAMDLLMVCVEAGMGIDSAIRRVSQEIYITSPELAKELRILSLELKTGKSRNSCLRNLGQRTNLPDVNNLVSLLIQADKYGTGVANALKIHAEEMRQKRYSRLEELAAKLPVKLVVPLILFIFPAFFVVIAGPAAIRVIRVILQG